MAKKGLEKFLEKHEMTPKPKKIKKDKSKLSNKEREDLIDEMLKDFGYIE